MSFMFSKKSFQKALFVCIFAKVNVIVNATINILGLLSGVDLNRRRVSAILAGCTLIAFFVY